METKLKWEDILPKPDSELNEKQFLDVCIYALRQAEKEGKVAINPELKDDIFIKHIQSHLQEGQEVICKICGRTVNDIISDRIRKGKDGKKKEAPNFSMYSLEECKLILRDIMRTAVKEDAEFIKDIVNEISRRERKEKKEGNVK